MKKIETGIIQEMNGYFTIPIKYYLIIPDSIKNDTKIMNIAADVIQNFNSNNYQLSIENIENDKYVVSTLNKSFIVGTENIEQLLIDGWQEAQEMINNFEFPEFMRLSKRIYDTDWSDA